MTIKRKCKAEKLGLKVGNTIFLLAGTKESICKKCQLECPYTIRNYSKDIYRQAKQNEHIT